MRMYEEVDTVRRGIAEHFEIGEREVGVAATVADEDLQAPQGNRRYLAQQPNRPDRAELVRAQDRSEEHTSELQSHRDLHSFPTRRSSDLCHCCRRGSSGTTGESALSRAAA